MRLPRFRIRTLMIAAAVIALDLAGLIYGPPQFLAECRMLT